MAHVSGWPDVLPRPVYRSLTKLGSLNAWFEVYRVADGVHAICEPFHYEEVISYLISGDKRAILLDTGMGVGDIRAEVEDLTSLPVAVVNTHSHYDHIGGNYQFGEVWAFDNDLEVGRIERGMTAGEVSDRLRPERVCAPFPTGFDPLAYEIRPSHVTRRLQPLEEIELGNRTLVVHHTPGHSPGGVCLFDSREHILFSGDLYYPGTLYCHLHGSNLDDYVKSLKVVAALAEDVNFVAPSHNEAKVPPQEILDALDGFLKIQGGVAEYIVRENTRLYTFGRFHVQYPHR